MHKVRKGRFYPKPGFLAVVTAVALAASFTVVGQASAAAPPPSGDTHVGHITPARQGDVGTQSGSGGARSGDFTKDTVADILVRSASTGQLRVYPHSGTYAGTSTYRPSTTIGSGWGTIRWIGQGDLNGDDNADVVYVDVSGRMWVALHSGTWNGVSTLKPGVLIGTGWQTTDLIYTYDVTGDGLDDVLARRAGTGDTYLYRNSGLNGTATFQPPALMMSGGLADVEQTMSDFTLDGVPDVLFIQSDGWQGVFDFVNEKTFWLGNGWQYTNARTVTDVNRDGRPDVLARRGSDGTLLAYTHSGSWRPLPDGSAYGTLLAPVVMGYGWQIHNVIT